MSIATKIARIQNATSTIRSKYVELGIAQSTDKIDNLATASSQIENRGAVTATVTEGSTYTIPKGYHNGSGTVTGIAPAEDATVESWETPDMTSENTPSPYSISSSGSAEDHPAWMAFDGKLGTYWESDDAEGDSKFVSFTYPEDVVVTGVRLAPASGDVTDSFPTSVSVSVTSDGGELTNVDTFPLSTPEAGVAQELTFEPVTAKAITLTFQSAAFAIAEIEFRTKESVTKYSLQSKVITPTTQQQNVTPDSGYYGLSSVTVNPIPTNYKDVSTVTADADSVLSGKVIVGKDGSTIAGTMPNNGSVNQTIDGLSVTSVTIPAGYTEGGTISLDDTIEQALAEI